MLGHRIVGPRDVVLGHDDAIDEQASDLKAYADALWDLASGHVKFKPGSKPTVWSVGPLTEAQKRHAKGIDVESPEWTDFVFCCCIHGVRDYCVLDNGSERTVSQPDRKDRPGMGETASREWLDASGIRLTEREWVARIAWMISEAGLPLSHSSGPPAGP